MILLTPKQQAIVKRASSQNKPCLALFWPVGAGKTIAALSIHRKAWKGGRMLIVARKNNLLTWEHEGSLLGFKITPIKYSYQIKKLKSSRHIVLSHDLLAGNWKKLRNENFKTIIVDESYAVQNSHSRRSKGIYQIARRIERRILLNALPFTDQGYVSVFSQYKILDNGETFGRSLTSFREKYQYEHPAGFGWIDNPRMFRRISRRAANHASFLTVEDCDLPQQISKTLFVELNPQQKKIYDDLRTLWEASYKNKSITVDYTVSQITKLHQVCGGIFRESQSSFSEIGTPKLEILEELLLQIKSRAVVWFCYDPEIHMAEKFLRQRKFNTQTLRSGSDLCQLENKWDVLLAQVRCGVGINDLTNVQYSIYYSNYWNYYYDYQSKGRTARLSSKHKRAFYFNLVTKNTVDELIQKSLSVKETNARRFSDLGRQYLLTQ